LRKASTRKASMQNAGGSGNWGKRAGLILGQGFPARAQQLGSTRTAEKTWQTEGAGREGGRESKVGWRGLLFVLFVLVVQSSWD
jgi:hypothetical protein